MMSINLLLYYIVVMLLSSELDVNSFRSESSFRIEKIEIMRRLEE